ncbi:hypothetical protein [Vibrio parahaemolyticus]|uniref:hypothetical protein n=1 Tax=Vibrio parahaemolyticus TaxID=670 RepID=UPI0023ED6337|nr:hypothetical protein [Vibrio parahaemolyticus]
MDKRSNVRIHPAYQVDHAEPISFAQFNILADDLSHLPKDYPYGYDTQSEHSRCVRTFKRSSNQPTTGDAKRRM